MPINQTVSRSLEGMTVTDHVFMGSTSIPAITNVSSLAAYDGDSALTYHGQLIQFIQKSGSVQLARP